MAAKDSGPFLDRRNAGPLYLSGYDGAPLDWAMALVDDLSKWRSGGVPWSAVSGSAVLCGPPWTGKTLWAKSLARTLNVPIVATSVGEWFNNSDGHPGDVIRASQRVFDDARATKPAILFIDELDAIPDRRTLSTRGRDWWQPVVNHVLTLLDGALTPRKRLIVIGATNHAHLLTRR